MAKDDAVGQGPATNAGLIFTPAEKKWIATALGLLEKSLSRSMDKYPADSNAYRAYGVDVANVRTIKEKFDA